MQYKSLFVLIFAISVFFLKVQAQVLTLANEPEQFIVDFQKQMEKQSRDYLHSSFAKEKPQYSYLILPEYVYKVWHLHILRC